MVAIPNDEPILIDWFCGAGGIAKGYKRAGFFVVGVDIVEQPRYAGDLFIQADALKMLAALVNDGALYCGPGLTIIQPVASHASPPCQASSDLRHRTGLDYPEHIPRTRELLKGTGLPYVIENVEGAALIDPVRICGASIPGLRVIRHRLFESNVPLKGVECPDHHPLVFTHDKRKGHYGQLDQDTSFVQVTGGGNATIANKRDAMGIDWPMTNLEINEAIPPAYGEHIGTQLMEAVS